MELLLKQVRYGELTEKDVHPETECRSVDTWFGPLCFYPYRQMTDDELAAFALVRDSAWEDDPDEVERIARKFAAEIVKLPPAMKLSESERSRISYSDLTEGYGMTFRTENTEGNEAAADGRPCEVYVYLRKRQDNGALRGEGVHVGYDFDYESLFFREEGASLKRSCWKPENSGAWTTLRRMFHRTASGSRKQDGATIFGGSKQNRLTGPGIIMSHWLPTAPWNPSTRRRCS